MRNTPEYPIPEQREANPVQTEFRFVMAEVPDALSEETRQHISAIINNPENFIDKGGIGKVYRLPNGLCLKVMEPRRLSPYVHSANMDLGNTPEIEALLQLRLNNVHVAGVRSPRCYGYYEASDPSQHDAILMEELDAVNLQHALNGDAEFPHAFHTETFINALEEYLDALHDIGIAHNDIAPRNIMVDRKTGLPRVIDFGRSVPLSRVTKEQREALLDKDTLDFEKEIVVVLYEAPTLTATK